MKQCVFCAILFLALVWRASGDYAKFESFIESENLWDTTPQTFLADAHDQSFFRWVSDKKDSARYPGYSNSPQITFLGNKCWEVLVRFDGGKLAEVTLSLYNRGDAGEMNEEKTFQTLLGKITDGVDAWAGEKAVARPAMRLANGMKIEKAEWVRNNSLAIELRWSASENIRVADPKDPHVTQRIRFRGEYIQLVITKFDPNKDPRKAPSTLNEKPSAASTARDIKTNVKKDADGNVWIENIPMVDQGQKGYCAAATAQRILEYYGMDIDEHVIAQVANTAAGAGTNPDKMIEVLSRLGVKFGVRVKTILEFNAQKFIAFVNDYNNAVRRQRKSEIVLGHTIDEGAIYREMDPDILKKVRCTREKGGMREFFSNVERYVDDGVPLAWSVMLGIVPETPALPQAAGGHMRIIFGYNKEKNEIIYSDSWGQGHERKTMGLDDAWTITNGLYAFEPRK